MEERLCGTHGNKQKREELCESPQESQISAARGRGTKNQAGEDEGNRQQGEATGRQHSWVCSNSVLSHIFWHRTATLLPCSEPCSCIQLSTLLWYPCGLPWRGTGRETALVWLFWPHERCLGQKSHATDFLADGLSRDAAQLLTCREKIKARDRIL